MNIYPPELTLHVYGKNKTRDVKMYDDWNNIYHHVSDENLGEYTW